MLQQEGSDTMLELRMGNSEEAKDHLHARTCQREAKRGEQGAWDKSLNGHERDHRICKHKNIMYLQYAIMSYM